MLAYDPEAAVAYLKRVDPVLARVIDAVGPFALATRGGVFPSLARAIVFQQLAGAAARAIWQRVLQALAADTEHFCSPEQLLACAEDSLREAGLSRQKLAYLRDLAEKFASGELNEAELALLDDEAVIRRVTAVKGIGRWTAEMLLIFTLGRPDVLPVDDLAVRRAFQRLYALDHLPKAEEMVRIAEPWRPYRSVGTWYLWRSANVVLPA
jgi:3-methyladenine DNA glycosylase/8-oxoguanine DNA glycosylase